MSTTLDTAFIHTFCFGDRLYGSVVPYFQSLDNNLTAFVFLLDYISANKIHSTLIDKVENAQIIDKAHT